jgi:hypothetical protein
VRRVPLAVLSGSLLSLLVASSVGAAGNVPSGQGLIAPAESGITNIECTDPTISDADLLTPRGGGAATWVDDGRMFLLQSIDVSGTVTTPDGTFPVQFSKTYGNKAGLTGDTITCTFDLAGPGFEGTGTATLVQVW